MPDIHLYSVLFQLLHTGNISSAFSATMFCYRKTLWMVWDSAKITQATCSIFAFSSAGYRLETVFIILVSPQYTILFEILPKYILTQHFIFKQHHINSDFVHVQDMLFLYIVAKRFFFKKSEWLMFCIFIYKSEGWKYGRSVWLLCLGLTRHFSSPVHPSYCVNTTPRVPFSDPWDHLHTV